MEQLFRGEHESRLMELFLFHFRQTGNTVEQYLIGTTAFATIDPANLQALLSTKSEDFDLGRRRDIMFPLFGDGIFTQEGEAWYQSRNLLRAPLYRHNYENSKVFERNVNNLIEILSRQADIVDLQPLFFRLAFDITNEYLFGNTVKSVTAPESASEQAFGKSFDTALAIVAKRFRLSNIYWMIGGSRFRQACSNVHRFADQMIDRNLLSHSSQESSVFLDHVAQKITDREALRGQMINLLAAGRDTTACLLTWTFFLLVRHPRVLEKLREEITTNCFDTASLTRTNLRKLHYLQNVLQETLRLYPSIPINDRKANKDTFLPTGGGPDRTAPVFIPKGVIVAFSTYALHRRPDLYGMDAEIFRPERWDEDMPMRRGKITEEWGYLPFNGGPRNCIGRDFALTEAAYTLVRILLHFPEMGLPAGQQIEITGVEKQTVTLVLSSSEGCRVKIR